MKKTIIFSALIIIFDQIIKGLISSNMYVLQSIDIIPSFFKITYVQNTGAAFSILNGNTFLLIVISFVLLYILYKFVLKNKKYDILSILLVGGIVANLIDRIFRGYVVDYLDFHILDHSFPVFNLADICIVIGCIMLVINTIKESEDIK